MNNSYKNNGYIYKNNEGKYTIGQYKQTRILDGHREIWEMEDGSLIYESISEIPYGLTAEQTINFIDQLSKYLIDNCTIKINREETDTNSFFVITNDYVYRLELFKECVVEDVEITNFLNINVVHDSNKTGFLFTLNEYAQLDIFKKIRYAYYAALYGWEAISIDYDGNMITDINTFRNFPDYQKMISYFENNDFNIKQIKRNEKELEIIGFDTNFSSFNIILTNFEYNYTYSGKLNIESIIKNVSEDNYYNEDTDLYDTDDSDTSINDDDSKKDDFII